MISFNFSFTVPVIFLRRFSYKTIKRATNDFSRVITTSSNGTSYKARFEGDHAAVVKEIHLIDQEDDFFYREVQLLGRLNHRHVVSLTGFSVGQKKYPTLFLILYQINQFAFVSLITTFYFSSRFRFLIFENVENGSLKEHLNGNFCSLCIYIYTVFIKVIVFCLIFG